VLNFSELPILLFKNGELNYVGVVLPTCLSRVLLLCRRILVNLPSFFKMDNSIIRVQPFADALELGTFYHIVSINKEQSALGQSPN